MAAHPETQFTIVFPPVDMFYWDGVIRRGELDRVLEAERSIFEALAPYENVRVFSFFDDAEIATNFDLYSDTVHFLPEINTEIFEMTVAGEYQLTVENVDARIAVQRAMIEGYDYTALFASKAKWIVNQRRQTKISNKIYTNFIINNLYIKYT